MSKYTNKYERYTNLHQESRFATPEEIRESGKMIDLREKCVRYGGIPLLCDTSRALVDDADHHSIIFGATGSGKTRRLILIYMIILIKAAFSLIVIDVKGELKKKTSGLARQMGYNIVALNFRDFKNGDCWNPLEEAYRLYHSGKQEEAFSSVADFMSGLAAKQYEHCHDLFWPGMAEAQGKATLQSLLECVPESMCNVASFAEMCSESNYEIMMQFSRMLSRTSPTAMSFRGIYSAAEKTRQSIEVTLYEMIKIFTDNRQLQQMLSKSTFDMHAIGREKTIVYLEIADEKPTYYSLVGMFVKQAYEILIGEAQNQPDGKLDVPVALVLDEFCNIPKIENFSNIIATSRSRNICSTIVVQSNHQLERLYGYDADVIKGNCTNWFYLYSRELSLLNEISELCGNIKTVDGEVRRLISPSELQRLKVGETLVLHDRLYPYITRMPDISEYKFPAYPEVASRPIEKTEIPVVDIRRLTACINEGLIPTPFASDVPAIDIAMKKEQRVGHREGDGRKAVKDEMPQRKQKRWI